MPLQEYDQIRLREDIQGTLGDTEAIKNDHNRTPGKDEVAEYIRDNVISEGRWPMQMTELAEETGYSRQHVSNVIQDYYRGVNESDNGVGDPATNTNPMSAGPTQPAGTTEPTDAQATKSVFIRVDGQIQEVKISLPPNIESRESYVRGYLDAIERSA